MIVTIILVMGNHAFFLILVIHVSRCLTFIFEEPDVDLYRSIPEIIEARGYSVEEHEIRTRDDYILIAHRIINPHVKKTRGVVLTLPSLGVTSKSFIINSAGDGYPDEDLGFVGNNLGFELSKRGYDVWLGNYRGVLEKHAVLDIKRDKREFYNFSFDEIIQYDLPDIIDYIMKLTKSTKIGFVGHSQGTAAMFGLMSRVKKFNHIIQPFIALAPVTVASHQRSPMFTLISNNPSLVSILEKRNDVFVDQQILKSSARICSLKLIGIKKLCRMVLMLLITGDDDSGWLNEKRIPVYFSDGYQSSSKNMAHWTQNINSGIFRQYDYGPDGNINRYNSTDPPEYVIQEITSPHIALFSGTYDGLSTPTDVERLRRSFRGELILMFTPVSVHHV